MIKTVDFPGTAIVKDADKANYQNYLAWQAQTAARKRQSQTQFNAFQSKSIDRLCSQHQFKEEIEREIETNKDVVERRLSMACSCSSCDQLKTTRSNSDTSTLTTPPSPTKSRGSMDSLALTGSRGSTGATAKAPTSPSSRNSLIVSPPPTSRHHKRKCHQPDSYSKTSTRVQVQSVAIS